jgi:hypothetical protein
MTMPSAMSFCNLKDFASTFRAAERYAGPDGHLATMTDIIFGRVASNEKSIFWNRYFTTMSAEYYGLYKGEKPTIVVAHGVGPLSTLEGIESAYHAGLGRDERPEYGQISQDVFDKLVEGEFGEVRTVDVEELFTYYNFILALAYKNGKSNLPGLYDNGYLTTRALAGDPLYLARVGNSDIALSYLNTHERVALAHFREMKSVHGILIEDNASVYAAKMDWSYRAPYDHYDDVKKWYVRKPAIDRLKGKGFAYAHLLSIGQIIRTGLHVTRYDQLTFDIGTHGWSDGYRLLGMRDGSCHNVKEFNFAKVESKTPPSAHVSPVAEIVPTFTSLIEVNQKLFTEAPKDGCSADTGTVVFEVSSAKGIGEPVHINLKEENMFVLRYDLDEVLAVKPEGANAYLRTAFDPRGQWIVVQFYDIEVNQDTRLVEEDELAGDLDRLMAVIEELEAA